jgi:hypothetical protein
MHALLLRFPAPTGRADVRAGGDGARPRAGHGRHPRTGAGGAGGTTWGRPGDEEAVGMKGGCMTWGVSRSIAGSDAWHCRAGRTGPWRKGDSRRTCDPAPLRRADRRRIAAGDRRSPGRGAGGVRENPERNAMHRENGAHARPERRVDRHAAATCGRPQVGRGDGGGFENLDINPMHLSAAHGRAWLTWSLPPADGRRGAAAGRRSPGRGKGGARENPERNAMHRENGAHASPWRWACHRCGIRRSGIPASSRAQLSAAPPAINLCGQRNVKAGP